MAGTKDIKDFTKYPSLSDSDILLGTKTDLGGTDAGITVSSFKKQVAHDVKPEIKNGYWWVLGINTGQLAIGKTPKFRYGPTGLEMKYEGEDDSAFIQIIPLSDLVFKFENLTPEQVLQLKLQFSDLTETDKLELRGEAFTYDMFTHAQLDELRLTWEKMTPEQKLEIRGERGYSASEVWAQQEGNAGKTEEEYLAWLREPATSAATAAEASMVQLSEDVKQLKEDLSTSTAQVISDTNKAKDNAITATGIAMSVSDNPGYIGDDYHVYQWDYTVDNYVKTDRVLRPEGFSIYRQYTSISLMEADKANVPEGKFVLINTSNVEQGDNARLYVKGATDFEYLVDMSGAIGFTGKTPQISIGTVTTGAAGSQASASLSPDGTDEDGNPKYKLNQVIPQGLQGFTPELSIGKVTTGLPGTPASAEMIDKGITESGAPKKEIILTIPAGATGSVEGVYKIQDIDHVPGESDLTYEEAGKTLPYPIGAELRYYDPDKVEHVFYKLFDLADGKAVWKLAGSSGDSGEGLILLSTPAELDKSYITIKDGGLGKWHM